MSHLKKRVMAALCGLILSGPILMIGSAQQAIADPIITLGGCVSPKRVGANQTVPNDAGTGTITMAPVTADAYYEKYASSDGQYTFELYKGSTGESSTTDTEMDALTQASLDGAVDGEAPSSSEQTTAFSSLPAPSSVQIQASVLTTPTKEQVASYGPDGAPRCAGDAVPMRDGTVKAELEGGFILLPSNSDTLSETSGLASMPAATSPWSYYVHAAFIPVATSGITPCGTFRGDNRSFATTGSSRSRISIKGDWANKRIVTQKLVSATHRTSPSPATRTASSNGIRFAGGTASATYFRIEAAHSVGNPLCSLAGPIQYNDIVQMWRTGAVIVYSKGIQVPNHEMYAFRANNTYSTVARLTGKGFHCLTIGLPVCSARFEVNKTLR